MEKAPINKDGWVEAYDTDFGRMLTPEKVLNKAMDMNGPNLSIRDRRTKGGKYMHRVCTRIMENRWLSSTENSDDDITDSEIEEAEAFL